MQPTRKLREILSQGRLLVAPFCYDAFTARIAESVGFPIIYVSGFGTVMSRGYPDVGVITLTEMVDNARYVTAAVRVPVIADADTGYGNPINVARTVGEFERAGVAGIHLEDQVFPKKCGFFAGKQVIPLEENVAKIRAALDARTDPEFLIIARCDALAIKGWEDTIRRCRAYHDAGADMVFVDGIKTLEDMHTYARELADLPRFYNGDLLPVAQVEELGFRIMIHRASVLVVYKAVREVMEELKEKGSVDRSRTATREEVAELLGLSRIYEMEDRYATLSPSSMMGKRG
ncbi:MAG: oxaloacetate decarboxylase [Candidatus Binatia bacterium]